MDFEVIASKELFPADELEIEMIRLPSGEKAVRFVNCTGKPPVIYFWALDDAMRWVNETR